MGWKDKLKDVGGAIGGAAGGITGNVSGKAKDKIEEMKEKAAEKARDTAMERAIEKLPADKVNLSNPSIKTLVGQAVEALGFKGDESHLLSSINSALGLRGRKELTDLAQFGPQQLAALYDKIRDAGHMDDFREKFVGAVTSAVPGFKVPDGKGLLGATFDQNAADITAVAPAAIPAIGSAPVSADSPMRRQ